MFMLPPPPLLSKDGQNKVIIKCETGKYTIRRESPTIKLFLGVFPGAILFAQPYPERTSMFNSLSSFFLLHLSFVGLCSTHDEDKMEHIPAL